MQELRVTFSPPGHKNYKVRLTTAEGRPLGVEVPFIPFLDDNDYDDLRWYLEEYMDLPDGGSVVRAKRIEENLANWGRTLHDALFEPKENGTLLKDLLTASKHAAPKPASSDTAASNLSDRQPADRQPPEPRVLTIATQDPTLLRLPWELMADDAGSLAFRVSIRRQLDPSEAPASSATPVAPEPSSPRPASLPLRILYIVSRPSDAGFIDPRLTSRALFDALDPLGASVQADFCRPPSLERMETMLSDANAAGAPYDIVHFDGHGAFDSHAHVGALCFEKSDDGAGASKTRLVSADELGDLLAKFSIPLVVLEACRSAMTDETVVFRSVAPRLIRAGVGSVLSMSHAVHVEAARLLLDRFYRELARGASIGRAVAEGRSALRTVPARWIETGPQGRTVELQDWFQPHLYQRGSDDALIPSLPAGSEVVRKYDLFLSYTHRDHAARVEELAGLLGGKHGFNVWLDKWECASGNLKAQCEKGIRESRFTVVAASRAALASDWVRWEIEKHKAFNPEGDRLLPIVLEELELPEDLNELYWMDCTDPEKDAKHAAFLARLIRSADAEDARRRRGFRSPAAKSDESGPFPPPPQYGFHGRAKELYDLERRFRSGRGVVLHAMGGMGKTALATEAATWWTRSGLFRDGACFLSFERFVSADRVVQVLGAYLEGPNFDARPAAMQRSRAIEAFREKAVLMVWDNFESALPQFNEGDDGASPYTDEERGRLNDLFRDLTAGEGRGRLLITCRPGDAGLPGALRYELQGLARADSLWLLSQILKRDGVVLSDPRLSRQRLDPLLNDLADHPLSIELVGPHLRTLAPEAIRTDFGKLLSKFKQDAREGRNQSLLASLEFSLRRLSPAARKALPWLGLFSGGVFEAFFLAMSQLAPEAWEPVRSELQGIALVRIEEDIQIADRPFLRFHPTLAHAAREGALAEKPEVRERFIDVYLAVRQMLYEALQGSQSRAALEILNREEVNYRTAVRWAVADGRIPAAARLGDTFSRYLQMSNRLRERDAWVLRLKGAVAGESFTAEAADYERQHAWTRFTQGDPKGAVDQLQSLIERLRHTTEFDPAFQLALAVDDLGRVLVDVGASTQAIPILHEAIGLCETLVEKAGGRPWEELLTAGDHAGAATELGNLSATMGDLANALKRVCRLDEALAVAEKALGIMEKLGRLHGVAVGHGRCAAILMEAGRFKEADARYDLALAAARKAGDKGVEGTTLQHQGGLAHDINQLDRAADLYRQALRLFQEAGDEGGVMETFNLLGGVDLNAGRLAEARTWYEKSRELAKRLNDQCGLGTAAQNIGIVCQQEGEAARARGDEPAARRHFEAARRSVEESLKITQTRDYEPDEAGSLGQLAKIHLLMGDLDAAERHANEALEICEPLGLKDAWKDYHTLSEIARARGDETAAAEWARKRDDLLEELERRARGDIGGGGVGRADDAAVRPTGGSGASGDAGGQGADGGSGEGTADDGQAGEADAATGGMPAELLQALQQLTLACAQAGFGEGDLAPEAEEALAHLEGSPGPASDFAAFLRSLAAGRLPPVPASLPTDLCEMLESLSKAIREAPTDKDGQTEEDDQAQEDDQAE